MYKGKYVVIFREYGLLHRSLRDDYEVRHCDDCLTPEHTGRTWTAAATYNKGNGLYNTSSEMSLNK